MQTRELKPILGRDDERGGRSFSLKADRFSGMWTCCVLSRQMVFITR